MPTLLTSTSKSRSRFTHLYPRDFKPASKGEKKKIKAEEEGKKLAQPPPPPPPPPQEEVHAKP
jgi:hypothetical protein